jgi:hypothetical protein
MRVKKIFLASSEELKEDRRAFELMLARLNQQWRGRDLAFDLIVWENFIDAMSREGLQREYNKAVQDSDIFVMLFFTKVGPYTLEEFNTAFADLATGQGPKIYTYFRNDYVLTGDIDEKVQSLLEFKARLKSLKHYPTYYRNTEDLQWQFSRQLEMLYGDERASEEITNATPQATIGETALILTHRQLFADGGAQVDGGRLKAAVMRASRQVRGAVFEMAVSVRRENWDADKLRMERCIPVFEALIQGDPKWHAPYGQLGYALKDKLTPEWERALELLTRAADLRGDRFSEGVYYSWCRAECMIQLDPRFRNERPAEATTKSAIIEMLRQARREIESMYDWQATLEHPTGYVVRTWLKINGSPRLG